MNILEIIEVGSDISPFIDIPIKALIDSGHDLRLVTNYPVGNFTKNNYLYKGFSKFRASTIQTVFLNAKVQLKRVGDRRYRDFADSIGQWDKYGLQWGTWRLVPWDHVASQCRGWKPDLIHVHFAWNLEFAVHLAKLLNVPVVCSVRGSDIYVSDEWKTWLRDQSVRRVICVSEAMRSHILSLQPDLEFKLCVVYNGLNSQLFDPPVPPPSSMHVLCPANLVPVKNHAWLIRAISILTQRNIYFRCTIMGSGHLLDEIRHRVAELGLESRCEFPGRQPHKEVIKALDASTVLALTSRSEGLPNVVVEAGARQRCCAGTDIPAIREATGSGMYGRLVPLDDDEGLADALMEAHRITLEQGPDLRKGRKFIMENFHPDAHLSKLLDIYEKTCSTS